MSDLVVPVHAPATAGAPFDFGSHFNDILVPREDTRATEVFTVRVPGSGGCVPLHVHEEMEQTFVFLAGVGEAFMSRDGAANQYRCRPGDVLFVPTGWHHQVSSPGPEGVVYLTVNSFLPHVARVGDTALEHAQIADQGFDRTTVTAALPGALEVFRCAESRFRPDPAAVRVWPDEGALDTTLTQPPDSYRVRKVGPFEYATAVTPVPRLLDPALADELHALASGVPVYVEGSQSPLSAKAPHAGSDLDILLSVTSPADLPAAREAVQRLAAFAQARGLPLSPGIVHRDWLDLPNFYSAVDLDPASDQRRWLTAGAGERTTEAARRQREALALLEHPEDVADLLARSLDLAGCTDAASEWRITPRWQGL